MADAMDPGTDGEREMSVYRESIIRPGIITLVHTCEAHRDLADARLW
jgi:hypothetical protein